jgi:DNA-binding MarR family transcriptional regulator
MCVKLTPNSSGRFLKRGNIKDEPSEENRRYSFHKLTPQGLQFLDKLDEMRSFETLK